MRCRCIPDGFWHLLLCHSNKSYFWVYLLRGVKSWSSYWHELHSQTCLQLFLPPCLDSAMLVELIGQEIFLNSKFTPQKFGCSYICCDLFPMWMTVHVVAVKQFMQSSSLWIVVLCKNKKSTTVLPPVMDSSKWWMWREECGNNESTVWYFSSLLSWTLRVLYTFF